MIHLFHSLASILTRRDTGECAFCFFEQKMGYKSQGRGKVLVQSKWGQYSLGDLMGLASLIKKVRQFRILLLLRRRTTANVPKPRVIRRPFSFPSERTVSLLNSSIECLTWIINYLWKTEGFQRINLRLEIDIIFSKIRMVWLGRRLQPAEWRLT